MDGRRIPPPCQRAARDAQDCRRELLVRNDNLLRNIQDRINDILEGSFDNFDEGFDARLIAEESMPSYETMFSDPSYIGSPIHMSSPLANQMYQLSPPANQRRYLQDDRQILIRSNLSEESEELLDDIIEDLIDSLSEPESPPANQRYLARSLPANMMYRDRPANQRYLGELPANYGRPGYFAANQRPVNRVANMQYAIGDELAARSLYDNSQMVEFPDEYVIDDELPVLYDSPGGYNSSIEQVRMHGRFGNIRRRLNFSPEDHLPIDSRRRINFNPENDVSTDARRRLNFSGLSPSVPSTIQYSRSRLNLEPPQADVNRELDNIVDELVQMVDDCADSNDSPLNCQPLPEMQNKTFEISTRPTNRTIQIERPTNRTFEMARAENQTFNVATIPNQTMPVAGATNQTLPVAKYGNQTLPVINPNQTVKMANPLNRTFQTVKIGNQTFQVARPANPAGDLPFAVAPLHYTYAMGQQLVNPSRNVTTFDEELAEFMKTPPQMAYSKLPDNTYAGFSPDLSVHRALRDRQRRQDESNVSESFGGDSTYGPFAEHVPLQGHSSIHRMMENRTFTTAEKPMNSTFQKIGNRIFTTGEMPANRTFGKPSRTVNQTQTLGSRAGNQTFAKGGKVANQVYGLGGRAGTQAQVIASKATNQAYAQGGRAPNQMYGITTNTANQAIPKAGKRLIAVGKRVPSDNFAAAGKVGGAYKATKPAPIDDDSLDLGDFARTLPMHYSKLPDNTYSGFSPDLSVNRALLEEYRRRQEESMVSNNYVDGYSDTVYEDFAENVPKNIHSTIFERVVTTETVIPAEEVEEIYEQTNYTYPTMTVPAPVITEALYHSYAMGERPANPNRTFHFVREEEGSPSIGPVVDQQFQRQDVSNVSEDYVDVDNNTTYSGFAEHVPYAGQSTLNDNEVILINGPEKTNCSLAIKYSPNASYLGAEFQEMDNSVNYVTNMPPPSNDPAQPPDPA